MARSVCDRCAQDSPTLYCWRLGDSRLELDAPDRPAGPKDYDALRAAVSALLEGRPEAAAVALAAPANGAGEPVTPVAALASVADRVHAARARTAARLRNSGRA